MRKLFVLALVGLASQLVDGALGMGYGVTSSSLLLLAGLSPALTSASVHLSEIGTTLISGAAHHRLGNTDWRLVARLGGPGAVGALLGAGALSGLSANAAAPVTSGASPPAEPRAFSCLFLFLRIFMVSTSSSAAPPAVSSSVPPVEPPTSPAAVAGAIVAEETG